MVWKEKMKTYKSFYIIGKLLNDTWFYSSHWRHTWYCPHVNCAWHICRNMFQSYQWWWTISCIREYTILSFLILKYWDLDKEILVQNVRHNRPNLHPRVTLQAHYLKGAVSRCFPATFDIAGLKPWLSTIAHTRNAPRTSRERYQVKYWKKGELQFILGYFF